MFRCIREVSDSAVQGINNNNGARVNNAQANPLDEEGSRDAFIEEVYEKLEHTPQNTFFAQLCTSKTYRLLYTVSYLLYYMVYRSEFRRRLRVDEARIRTECVELFKAGLEGGGYTKYADAFSEELVDDPRVVGDMDDAVATAILDELREQKRQHIDQLTFYSYALRLCHFRTFSPFGVLKNYNFVRIFDFSADTSRMDLAKLVKDCCLTQHFFLSLVEFFVKYAIGDVFIYMRNYEDRRNFIQRIVREEVDPRYVHTLWDFFEKLHPWEYDKMLDINDKRFEAYFLSLVKNLQNYLYRENSAENGYEFSLSRFDSLLFVFMCKVYFESYLQIKDWSESYLHVDVCDEVGMMNKRGNTHYPMVVRLCRNTWGVLDDNTCHVGDAVTTMYAYKRIIEERFGGRLRVASDSITTVGIGNFLLFRSR